MSHQNSIIDTGVDVALEDDEEPPPARRRGRRRTDNEILAEIARIVFPIVLAYGLAVLTARSEAKSAVETEIAVVKATEQSHFEEIQRTLRRVDEWMIRNEPRGNK